jgi:hypothetical protein
MKKILLTITLYLLSAHYCVATKNLEDVLPVLQMATSKATTDKVSQMMGKPEKIEENGRRTRWYYNCGELNIIFCWNKRLGTFEQVSIVQKQPKQDIFDERLSVMLKSGKTDVKQVLELLGTPRDMTIKGSKQVMHYFYKNNTLRLFFRDNILVDYTLIGQSRYM